MAATDRVKATRKSTLPLPPVNTKQDEIGRPTNARRIERDTAMLMWEAGFSACVQWRAMQTVNGSFHNNNIPAPPNPFRVARIPHDYDDQAIARMALAMMDRMAQKREEGCTGWESARPDGLIESLNRAVRTQKWVDVANYSMMLYILGD